MLEVRTIDALAPASSWDSLVGGCEGNALHVPEVHFSDHEPRDLLCFVFELEARVVACATAFAVQEHRLRWLPAGRRTLVLPTAPAFDGSVRPGDICRSLITFAKDRGFGRLMVHPTYSRWPAGDDISVGYETERIIEFLIDLRPGLEVIHSRMHKTHRKNVRRAIAQGLEVVDNTTLDGLMRLRAMQIASSRRAETRSGGFGVRDERFFERVHEHVYSKGRGHVIFARSNGEDLAALAWLVGGKRVITVRSGSLAQGYETCAMYLLYDRLIRLALEDGLVELNLGGVPAEAADAGHSQSGLHAFKKGFGGESVVRVGVDIPLGELAS